jgi:WD40 repeat protein
VAFSPDGKTLATGTGHETRQEKKSDVLIWDLAAGKPQAIYQGHSAPVVALAFSPDGGTLASGGCDRTVKLWDMASGKERATLKGHAGMVTSLAFAPDGKTLASAGWDRTIKLWDTALARERTTLDGHTDVVWAVAFSPDGKTLASASGDRTAKLWDVPTCSVRATFDKHTGDVVAIAFSQDGKSLATSDMDNIKLWDTATGNQQRAFDCPQTCSVAFTQDSRILSAATNMKYVELWISDPTTGQSRRPNDDHTPHAPIQVALSADGKVAAIVDRSGAVKFLDVAAGKAHWQASKRWKGFR